MYIDFYSKADTKVYRALENKMSRMSRKGVCSIEGCGKPIHGFGWCTRHYQQLYKTHPNYKPRDGYDGRRKNKFYAMWFDRKNEGLLCDEWAKDFREFERGISPRPEGNYFLIRLREGLFGPDNFQWQPHLRKREGESNKEW